MLFNQVVSNNKDITLYNVVQLEPLFAESVEELENSGDKSKAYILPDGYIYAYKLQTHEKTTEVVDELTSEWIDGARLSSSEDTVTAITGSCVSPKIDLTKYKGKTDKLKITIVGGTAITENAILYIQFRTYNEDGGIVVQREASTVANWAHFHNIEIAGATTETTTLTITLPLKYSSALTEIWGLKLGLNGSSSDYKLSISYEQTATVTETCWISTGVKFVNSTEEKELATKVSTLNNEGSDPTVVKLLPKPVLDFYNGADYPDDDYTTTHLGKVTYPCRADIPVPYKVKWEHSESAMRTTVAVDTKPIGSSNAYTLRTYDATGLNSYPIYNLLPNTTYYYKVTHILSDGALVDAKEGNFKTSSESIRLLHIDGTQNVRDLGGWTGLNSKKVKYGKIIRGAAFSDSSYPRLTLTGRGRVALGELKIQAELNLGAVDTETSIAANCVYKKIGYSNYATAITDASARGLFKTAIEWIVGCLTDGKPVYMHCQGGCDRTGTMSFQLLGLLGVSESDLSKEYELSSFSDTGYGRLRTTTKAVDTYDYVGMVEAIKAYDGDNITDKFYNFTVDCGVSTGTIESFRNLMLE